MEADAVAAEREAAEVAYQHQLAQQQAQQVSEVTNIPSAVVAPQRELVDDEDTVQLPSRAKVRSQAVQPVQVDLEQLVAEHLSVGEFGPALELAESVANAEVRNVLLQQIANAQLDAGEFNAALLAVRRIGDMEYEVEEAAPQTVEETLAGGNQLAQQGFQQLISLIQQQTSGPWFDIDGDGGMVSQFGDNTGGISVDPNGVMRHVTRTERDQRLASLGRAVRDADLNADIARSSDLRLVSLTRLDAEVSQRLADGLPVVETMRQLAGLTAVKFVFVFPESGEIVIGGPAEPWSYDAEGNPVGKQSGRPLLQLDDLVTVLRTFSDDGPGIFTCSIDPRSGRVETGP